MELKIGKMKAKELAEWFGISYGTFRNKKDEKLNELKCYCEFEEVYGGVNIKNIKIAKYEKKMSKIREIYAKGFEELRNDIDTVSNINDKIYYKYQDELPTLSSPDSGYHYAIEVRNANYGVPFKDVGKLGKCYYLWCKVSEDRTLYMPFTEEENKIKKELMTKYFGTDEEKDILIAQMVDAGEISEAEAYRMMREYRNLNKAGFVAFKNALQDAIGTEIVRATKFEKELYFEEPMWLDKGEDKQNS